MKTVMVMTASVMARSCLIAVQGCFGCYRTMSVGRVGKGERLRAMPTRSGGRENDRVGTAHAIELGEDAFC